MPSEVLSFDGGTFTETRVKVQEGDRALAPSGSLTWTTITTPTALAGCVGIDAKLVHGDRWQTIDANFTEMIYGDVKSTIFGNQIHTVMTNQTLTTIGNVTHMIVGTLNAVNVGSITHMIIGTYLGTYISPHTVNFISPMTENHAAPKTVNEPLYMKTSAIELASVGVAQGNTGLKVESVGVGIGVTGLKVEATALKQKSEALSAAMQGLLGRIIPLDGKVGAMAAKANPRVNAGPTVATSAPFGA